MLSKARSPTRASTAKLNTRVPPWMLRGFESLAAAGVLTKSAHMKLAFVQYLAKYNIHPPQPGRRQGRLPPDLKRKLDALDENS